MQRLPWPFSVLLALATTVASAAEGVSLRWDACFGDGGVVNRNFACDVNTGTHALVASFELAADFSAPGGLVAVIDLRSIQPSLPTWWQLDGVGACRRGSLTLSTMAPATAVNCYEWAQGNASGSVVAYQPDIQGASTARIVAASTASGPEIAGLLGGLEYFAFRLVLDHAETVGTGSCEGCPIPVCISLRSLELSSANARRTIWGPVDQGGTSDFAVWQGYPMDLHGTGRCVLVTATRRSSWGVVKSLYR